MNNNNMQRGDIMACIDMATALSLTPAQALALLEQTREDIDSRILALREKLLNSADSGADT